jgi:hypothetical protein
VDKLDSTVATKPEYIGWGSGAGTAAVGDLTLFTEESETRIGPSVTSGPLATETLRSQPAADTLRMVGTLTALAGKTITNAGTFTTATGSNNTPSGAWLIVKGDFTGVVLLTNDQITFTIDLQISA